MVNIQLRSMLISTTLVLTGCTSFGESRESLGLLQYDFIITDRPDELSYELRLTSRDPRSICVMLTNWPSDSSNLFQGSRAVLTSSNGENITASATANAGYAPGVMHEIASGKSLLGSISYRVFGDPVVIRDLPYRQLNYLLKPLLCSRQ